MKITKEEIESSETHLLPQVCNLWGKTDDEKRGQLKPQVTDWREKGDYAIPHQRFGMTDAFCFSFRPLRLCSVTGSTQP